MTLRKIVPVLFVVFVVSGIFSISLRGCGWTQNEIFAEGMFFLVAAGFSAMAFASCQKRWAVIISVLVMPVVGSWSYSILLLFSPGDLSVGPCVERSTWTAFPAMYLTTSCAALLNNTLWKNWFVAAIGSVIALTAAILLLRNLF